MAKNDELLHQEARSLASPSRIKYFDLVIAQGNGALLTDADGKEYIDLLASASSTNTGTVIRPWSKRSPNRPKS